MNDHSTRLPLNGNAVASVVLGLLWPFVGSIAAVVLGRRARRQLAEVGSGERGDLLARAGIIIGWVGIVGPVLGVTVAIVGLGMMGMVTSG